MRRKIRRVAEIALPVSGMAMIFTSVLYGGDSLPLQMIFVLFGVLILEAGVWGLANKLLPDERRYLSLREEVEHFITLVPELNEAAVAKEAGTENDARHRDTLEQMHNSVKRMGEVAAEDALAGESEKLAASTPAEQALPTRETAKTQ